MMLGSKKSSASDFTPNLSKPKSILSKLTSPFTPMKRNLAEYYIKTKEPHRKYAPGNRVKGAVIVTVTKPLRITHLAVSLHGFVKVFNNAKQPGESVYPDGVLLGGRIGKRGSEYFGNGFASLFENEIILCGEGRLEAGKFEFEFDLEIPPRGLPSSISVCTQRYVPDKANTAIQFERGTISYMVGSTLTRPTPLGPIAQCEPHTIQLEEIVDIGAIPRPKPQVVSVETLARKSMTKISNKKPAKPSSIGRSPVRLNTGPPHSANGSASSDPQTLNEPSRSPVPSTTSFVSAESSSASTYQRGLARPSPSPLPSSSNGSNDGRSNEDVPDHVVTAIIELLYAGCLPGDKLPLQISIKHHKPVKNLQGIIITMYREGHVDTHPAIPLGPTQNKKKAEYEDYYPKSRTGLGGLSLSSAGSSSGFRKDLSQKIVPLIVDPQSLTTVVKTTIQAPEDLFPTVSSVPGAMITFRYFVEVVIDLRGKLTGQDRFLPRLNMTSGASGYGYSDHRSNGRDRLDGFTGFSTDGVGILLTEQLRREKGVVSRQFEVTVGTHDSRRRRGRPLHDYRSSSASRRETLRTSSEDRALEVDYVPLNQQRQDELRQYFDYGNAFQPHDNHYSTAHGSDYRQPDNIPAPIIEGYSDEKSRVRRAEERLLPSAPTADNEVVSSSSRVQQPSAPQAFEDEDYSQIHRFSIITPITSNGAIESPLETAAYNTISEVDYAIRQTNGVPAPSVGTKNDKQELERRRLQMAASSPDYLTADRPFEQDIQSRRTVDPTAPILNENGHYQHHVPYEASSALGSHPPRLDDENLPSYQK